MLDTTHLHVLVQKLTPVAIATVLVYTNVYSHVSNHDPAFKGGTQVSML